MVACWEGQLAREGCAVQKGDRGGDSFQISTSFYKIIRKSPVIAMALWKESYGDIKRRTRGCL